MISTLSSPVFRQGHKLKKAMVAYERALDWQELFDLAVQEKTSEEELIERAHRVAGLCRFTRILPLGPHLLV